MRRLTIDPAHPDAAMIEEAADTLRRGGLVAFPTETVYGLGANALSGAAVEKIYAAKGRPAYNPIIVHIADRSQASTVAREWSDYAERLAVAFWPGPLTLVLPRREVIPDAVTAGLDTVGVRVPRHPVARALLVAAGLPVAAPSANRSMQLSPTTAAHVAKSLGDDVDLILDAGATTVGIESTVVDLSRGRPAVLRPGTITIPQLEAVVGRVVLPAAVSPVHADAPRPSPGMLDRHYAPRARLVLVDAVDVGMRVEHERANVHRTGALVIGADVDRAPTIVHMPPNAAAYAARLYDALHALDDAGCDVIVVERVPEGVEWLGVRDRLTRAAT